MEKAITEKSKPTVPNSIVSFLKEKNPDNPTLAGVVVKFNENSSSGELFADDYLIHEGQKIEIIHAYQAYGDRSSQLKDFIDVQFKSPYADKDDEPTIVCAINTEVLRPICPTKAYFNDYKKHMGFD